MIIPDDQPPSPDPIIQETIQKLQHRHDLTEYVEQLIAFNAHHLNDVLHELRERLLLQGLDEDDLHNIHEYLKITFDGDLMKTEDKPLTEAKAEKLYSLISTCHTFQKH